MSDYHRYDSIPWIMAAVLGLWGIHNGYLGFAVFYAILGFGGGIFASSKLKSQEEGRGGLDG